MDESVACHHFRSIFISDVHLGIEKLQSQKLLDFLQCTKSEYLYLAGDILDLLQARKKWHWPEINDRIVHAVFEKAYSGTKVFYFPGNHDHILRRFPSLVQGQFLQTSTAFHLRWHGGNRKNLSVFLNLQLPGSKYVVGDGPVLSEMKKNYPDVTFTGAKTGEELSCHMAAADVFVYSSLTDTFGIVLLQARTAGCR